MHSVKTNGDSIAHEFLKLMGNTPVINKKASVESPPPLPFDENEASDDISDEDLEALVVDAVMDESTETNDLDALINEVDDIEVQASATSDSAEGYVVSGLGKIANSLRAKGEGFAADVVEATAISIEGDLVKEAGRKRQILTSLDKIASELLNEGDGFASDMVRVTINKLGY